jgi:hypothetical protein
MGRKSKKRTDNLAAAAIVIAVTALAAGYYIQYRLRPFRILYPFTSTQRGWRDQAFEVALYAGLAAILLVILARVAKKL